jgi:hypothetical protein
VFSIPSQACDLTLAPEAGAQCVRSARWDLCGGPPERAVPTAIRRLWSSDQKGMDLVNPRVVAHLLR